MSSLLITGVILWYTEVQRSAVSMAACHVSTTHSPLTVASIRSMATRGTTASKMYLRPHLPSSPTEQQLATVKLLGMKTLAPEKSHNFYRKFLRMLLMPLKGRLAPSRHKHTHTHVFSVQVFLNQDGECTSECCAGDFCRLFLADHLLAVWLKANTFQAVNLTDLSRF